MASNAATDCPVKRLHADNKRAVHERLKALCRAADPAAAAASVYAPDAECHAFHPVNDLSGRGAIVTHLWQPLQTALPDLERRDSIVIAGTSLGSDSVSVMGHFQGTFAAPLFDIPPTGGVVHLRYGEVHELRDGLIVRSYVILDLLDLMRQAGCWPIAPSLGAEGKWSGPATADGVRPDVVDTIQGDKELATVRLMHDGLLRFDGKRLESMDHEQYWTRDFMWYGPSGIGTTRGLDGFRAHHQVPFLRAFPDRAGGNHIVRVGDGSYVVTGGWPSVTATHLGGDWLGLPATGKSVGMRVMDFYRNENDLIAENWVPIDIVHILLQLGVDVFDRVRHRSGAPRMSL